ncbi:hypothetical protein MKW98_003425 [Papaver atlanticum]|uniref:FAM192A/Fyv6 N-terminal domain-containing protein n=1 Tax=Papaver atlanticum TaxID=357466 RepID=A0AAD4TB23_9MAGN|nr:hypothetical protein MKW98_003425 [Papaver atlanticum]
MAEEDPSSTIRLMNFVSEGQLTEAKKIRGERPEDGTAQRDRPLFEILQDNKDKKDAEFNEKIRHRPPKALDEDETEFLDNIEMTRKAYEQQIADEEAQQLRSFQVAVAVHSTALHEIKETPPVPKVEEVKPLRRKNPPTKPLGGLIIKVKPQAKKAKTEQVSSPGNQLSSDTAKTSVGDNNDKSHNSPVKGTLGSLVSYSDESEDEEGG